MPKIRLVFVLIFALMSFVLVLPKIAQAATADQFCSNTNDSLYENVTSGGGEFSQSFYPTQNRLSQVSTKVGGYNFSGTATMRVTDGETILATSSRSYSSLSSQQIWYWNDFNEITITPGHAYKIRLLTTSSLYWYKSATCDTQGNAIAGGYPLTAVDFDFTTWGQTVADPTPTATPTPTSTPTPTPTSSPANPTPTLTAGTSLGTGAAPAATTSTAIKSPSNLAATDASAGNVPAVKLTWKASTTTDITGYKIFRSTEEKTGFKEVGKSVKAVIEFTDPQVQASTKYYYFVRAYKGTAESASSNTTNITTAAAVTATPTATARKRSILPANLNANISASPLLTSAFGIAILLILGALVFYFYKKRKINKGLKP